MIVTGGFVWGGPSQVFSVNEADPPRDEALDYDRKLLAPDVPTIGRMNAPPRPRP